MYTTHLSGRAQGLDSALRPLMLLAGAIPMFLPFMLAILWFIVAAISLSSLQRKRPAVFNDVVGPFGTGVAIGLVLSLIYVVLRGN